MAKLDCYILSALSHADVEILHVFSAAQRSMSIQHANMLTEQKGKWKSITVYLIREGQPVGTWLPNESETTHG